MEGIPATSSDPQICEIESGAQETCNIEKAELKKSGPHCNKIMASFLKLSRDGLFCDVTVKSKGYQVRVHKAVLASASDYFRAMFVNETKEATSSVIDFSEMPTEVVTQCIQFIYSGEVEISMDFVRELVDAAEMMQLPDLSKLCVEFLSDRIDIKSCAEVIMLSNLYCKDSLNEFIGGFLATSLREFAETDEFLSLDIDSLLYCLKLLPEDCAIFEVHKWDSIVAWVMHSREKRVREFPILFDTIDLSCVPKSFMNSTILSNCFVTESTVCLSKIAKCYCEDNSPPTKKCKTEIYAFSSKSKAILQYETKSGQWLLETIYPGHLSSHTDIIFFNGCIYAGDGCSISRFCDGKWAERKLVNEPYFWEQTICLFCRESHNHNSPPATVYNKCVGVGNSVYMVTKACVWEFATKTSTFTCHRADIGLGKGFFIATSSKKIYIMGGESTENALFEFDMISHKCARLSDMSYPKPSGFAAWYDEKVYTFSDSSDCSRLIVECYDPRFDCWITVPDVILFQPISRINNVYITDKLYIIGRHWENPCHQAVELRKLKVPTKYPDMDKCFLST